jgi:RecA-family ATPase
LRSIPGHKFVVADSCYNVLRFVGQAKINETAVKAALNLLDHLCAVTNSTMLYLWHPSQAGIERGDASGWSVAWNNTPRARLSISRDRKSRDAFDLKVEKRNNGPTGDTITLHWHDGVLLPRSDLDTTEQSALLYEACISVALLSAENGSPITKQRNLFSWQLDEIERAAGRAPSQSEVKEQLALAVSRGRLRYLKGYGKQQAGYFPRETDPALMRETGHDTAASAD